MDISIILNPYFVILNVSFLLTVLMLIYTMKIKHKTQLHYVSALCIVSLIIWGLGQILEVYFRALTGISYWGFVYFYFIGVCSLPPFLLFLGVVYKKRHIKLKPKYLWIFLPSILSYIALITSKWHGLFMNKYSPYMAQVELGPLFWVHNIITYIYIIVGLSFILYTSLKASGFFSKQSFTIVLAILIPFSINALTMYGIVEFPVFVTPISFTATILLLLVSILQYDFLNVMPIALGNIFDQMTDGIIMLDKSLRVIDYNNAAKSIFVLDKSEIKRNRYLQEIVEDTLIKENEIEVFLNNVKKTVETNERYNVEKSVESNGNTMHLSIDVSNVIVKDKYYCTVIFIKDVTELRNQMQRIQRNQEIIMEKERLASLGNLIGGIAHNLKTPIMAISGMTQSIEVLGNEYRDSIDDPLVTPDDHREIATELLDWAGKIGPYCSYMSEMISAVKGQAVSLSYDDETVFTLRELLSRINILMRFELKKYHCELRQSLNAPLYTGIKGDLSILVQVFNNIITNAIHAYEGNRGIINFKISSSNDRILFIITDKGIGIPESIQEKLFKEMVTTKGKDGTGLGMYMAHSTIRGHFDGDLRFSSEVGKGTTFYIDIPIYKEVSNA